MAKKKERYVLVCEDENGNLVPMRTYHPLEIILMSDPAAFHPDPAQRREPNPEVQERLRLMLGALEEMGRIALAAFRPAAEFYGEGRPFRTAGELHRFLKSHPEIRTLYALARDTGAPDPHRRLIHAGDWYAYLKTAGADVLGFPEAGAVADALREEERRKAEERGRRAAWR